MADIKKNTDYKLLNSKEDKVWQQLNENLSNTPNDLMIHTQRILFCLDNELAEQACAALQDLFFVLQGNGNDLSTRMFNLVSPIIELKDRDYFQQYLSGDVSYRLDSRQYDGALFVGKPVIEKL